MKTASQILVVEDNNEDFVTITRAFKEVKMANPLARCVDGEQALAYLFRRGKFANAEVSPRPTMILLDLNLPGTDGREVLKQIKADPSLKLIPVIILTTSSDERDIERCYEEGANSYMQKPVSFDKFVEALKRLRDYWFEMVLLPKSEDFSALERE